MMTPFQSSNINTPAKGLVVKVLRLLPIVLVLHSFVVTVRSTSAQTPQPNPQTVLEQASSQGRYTFLIFYRENNEASRAMADTVNAGMKNRPGVASAALVQITNPQYKPLVDRFGVSRAPMPLTVALAPNGAMTGIYASKVTEAQLAGAFVTKSMAECMKAMQAGKIVMLCVQPSATSPVPQAVSDLQADAQFRDRVAVVPVLASDLDEAELLRELKVDTNQPSVAVTVVMAPPGVMVGNFASSATKDDITVALHKAGKCCDDPNCKHGKVNTTKR